MSRVAEAIGVSRSQLHARASRAAKPRGAYCKAEDAELLPAIRRLVELHARPTYGYRRITALPRTASAAPLGWSRSTANGCCASSASTA